MAWILYVLAVLFLVRHILSVRSRNSTRLELLRALDDDLTSKLDDMGKAVDQLAAEVDALQPEFHPDMPAAVYGIGAQLSVGSVYNLRVEPSHLKSSADVSSWHTVIFDALAQGVPSLDEQLHAQSSVLAIDDLRTHLVKLLRAGGMKTGQREKGVPPFLFDESDDVSFRVPFALDRPTRIRGSHVTRSSPYSSLDEGARVVETRLQQVRWDEHSGDSWPPSQTWTRLYEPC